MTFTETLTSLKSTLKSPEPRIGINLKSFPFRLNKKISNSKKICCKYLQIIEASGPHNWQAELNPESTVVQVGVPHEDHALHGDLLGVVEVDIAGLHVGAVDLVLHLHPEWSTLIGRDLEILCSDWWNLTMLTPLTPRSMP